MVHACNSSILEAEAGGSQVQSQPWLCTETLSLTTQQQQQICREKEIGTFVYYWQESKLVQLL
jgi:hypothetical protein